MRSSRWQRSLDEMFGKISWQMHELWRTVDDKSAVLESFETLMQLNDRFEAMGGIAASGTRLKRGILA